MFETEIKNKAQLNSIKRKIEKNTNKKVLEIKCQEDLYEEGFFITVLLEDRKGFFMEAFVDKDLMQRQIDSICKRYIRLEKQNS